MTVIFLVNSQAAHRIASKICYLYDKIQTFLQGLTFKVKRFWFVFFFFFAHLIWRKHYNDIYLTSLSVTSSLISDKMDLPVFVNH